MYDLIVFVLVCPFIFYYARVSFPLSPYVWYSNHLYIDEYNVSLVHFQAIYVFGFGVPLFMVGIGGTTGALWGLWFFHKLLLTAVYGFILFVHFSKWREKLPRKYISGSSIATTFV